MPAPEQNMIDMLRILAKMGGQILPGQSGQDAINAHLQGAWKDPSAQDLGGAWADDRVPAAGPSRGHRGSLASAAAKLNPGAPLGEKIPEAPPVPISNVPGGPGSENWRPHKGGNRISHPGKSLPVTPTRKKGRDDDYIRNILKSTGASDEAIDAYLKTYNEVEV